MTRPAGPGGAGAKALVVLELLVALKLMFH
jgi:hypothetical protein